MSTADNLLKKYAGSLTFHVPPKNQGQIVKVAYAVTEMGLVRRIYDRNDQQEEYSIHKWTRALNKYDDPWNSSPPVSPNSRWWKPLTRDQKKRLGIR